MSNPLDVSSDVPQLFVDDVMVRASGGVWRTLHHGRKLDQPVLVPDRPWEGRRVYVYGTIHRDQESGLFRMWYLTRIGRGNDHRSPAMHEPQGDMVLYATSEDGLHWQKPDLGRHQFDGTTNNNIVLFDKHSPTLIIDPEEPKEDERYRMMAWQWRREQQGYWIAHSADGLEWHEYPVNPVLDSGDEILETVTLARHEASGEYFAFHRRWDKGRFGKRLIAVATSNDFRHWSHPATILVPDERDDQWVMDDGQRTEFYGMAGFRYGGQFLGFLPVFDIVLHSKSEIDRPAALRTEQSPWEGPIAAQLAHSRDGRQWHRFGDRSPIIARGERGSFDAGCILCSADRPVVVGDEVWHYYTGINTMHGGPIPPKMCVIGRASWRLDGFVSLDAGAVDGWVQTPAINAAGRKLQVNANAADGSLTVDAVLEDGQPLQGYAAADCVPLRADAVRHVVRWGERDRLPAERPISLRFRLRDTELYGFRLQD